MKKRKFSSIGLLLALTVVALLVIFSIATCLLFGDELLTMAGIERIGEEDLFTMESCCCSGWPFPPSPPITNLS